jgi:hypothetical protein
MKLKLFLCLLALIPTLGFAKIGDLPADATARWGKPSGTKYDGAFVVYNTPKYMIVQMYNLSGDGRCFVALYYKMDGSQIATSESQRLDAVNVPPETVFHVVDSGAPGITQWDNADDTFATLAGLVFINGKNLYNRGYMTEDGFKFITSHPELMSGGANTEGEETGKSDPSATPVPKATPKATPSISDETKA